MTLPPLTMDTVLRDVQVDDHRLITWETGRRNRMGKTLLAYRLIGPDGRTVFEGDDYAVPGIIDDDASVRGLLGFLTLRPGDVESAYFDNYTPEQLEWRDEHAECLRLYAEEEGDSVVPPFDLPDHPLAFATGVYS